MPKWLDQRIAKLAKQLSDSKNTYGMAEEVASEFESIADDLDKKASNMEEKFPNRASSYSDKASEFRDKADTIRNAFSELDEHLNLEDLDLEISE